MGYLKSIFTSASGLLQHRAPPLRVVVVRAFSLQDHSKGSDDSSNKGQKTASSISSESSKEKDSNEEGKLEEEVKDEEIHPDWLAMERRVKFRTPKKRSKQKLAFSNHIQSSNSDLFDVYNQLKTILHLIQSPLPVAGMQRMFNNNNCYLLAFFLLFVDNR